MKKSELMNTNPLLRPFADDSVILFPAFDKIKPEHFRPALNFAMAETRRSAKKIAENKEDPTFSNTVSAFEKASGMLDYVFGVFCYYTYISSNDPEIEKLQNTHFPKLMSLYADIYMNDKNYKRFKKLEAQQAKLGLTPQQAYVLEVYSETFRYYGCHLNKTKKARIKEIDEELVRKGTEFDYNLQQQRKAYGLVLDNPDDMTGMPDDAIQMAYDEGIKRNMPGKWVITAEDSMDSFVSVYADNRALRKRYYREVSEIGMSADGNNIDVLKELLALRHERAQLSDYRTYADFAMTFNMALTKRTTLNFLNDLKRQTLPTARRDLAEIKRYARSQGVARMEPWDFPYYCEKMRKEKLKFNSESLRPYFSLEHVLDGAFKHCEKLHGVKFTYNEAYPKPDEKCFPFDVHNSENGEYLGTLLVDPYLRDGKVGGNFCIETLSHGKYADKLSAASAILHLNFARPTKDNPTLLNEEEVKIIFHEIGHGMHMLLGKAEIRLLSGMTCVTSDFGELPSQINERWALEPEVLQTYARHYKTGEPVPQELIDQLQENNRFMGGQKLLRKLRYSYMDLALHGRNPKYINLDKFEPKFLQENFPLMAFKNLAPTLPTFDHIASSGYESNYYNYIWSEALDADSFTLFKQKGLYDPETCKKFREMLKAGGTGLASDLYETFRGHGIDSKALLARYGIGRHKEIFNKTAAIQQPIPLPANDSTAPAEIISDAPPRRRHDGLVPS